MATLPRLRSPLLLLLLLLTRLSLLDSTAVVFPSRRITPPRCFAASVLLYNEIPAMLVLAFVGVASRRMVIGLLKAADSAGGFMRIMTGLEACGTVLRTPAYCSTEELLTSPLAMFS